MSQVWQRSAKAVEELTPYEGRLDSLTEDDKGFFWLRYELPFRVAESYIKRNYGRYVIPVLDTQGVTRGFVARQGWPGSPLEGKDTGQKAYTFMHAKGPVQSFYRGSDLGGPSCLVLVEDQLSAIKCAVAGFDSCALLGMPVAAVGSYSGSDRIREIASLRPKEVVVAMDADATDKAFQFARNWSMAFTKCRVVILAADIKDTPLNDIREVLSL